MSFYRLLPIPENHVRIILGVRVTAISVLALTAVVSARGLMSAIRGYSHKKALKSKVRQKRVQVDEQKKKLRQKLQDGNGELVNEKRRYITSLGIHDLVDKLQNGELRCLEVLQAYQAKALEATEQLNCVTEFLEEAEERAIALDNCPTKGPLHGVPFSVKECYPLAGSDATYGIAKSLDRPLSEDGSLVTALMTLGAIPFCKTNLPQTVFSFGCSNPIWGETKHPSDPERTPGGSSSGEGALIGYGASLFGIGSDIGGSVRVPASFCGIAALKVTIPRLALKSSSSGMVGLIGLPGIMARDVETLIFVSKLLWSSELLTQCDPFTVPLLWQEKLFQTPGKLRIGYYEECDRFPVTPGVKRAVQMARQLLLQDGHQLIPFHPPNLDQAAEKFVKFAHANQLRVFEDALMHEEVDPAYSLIHRYGSKIPWLLRPLAAFALRCFSPIQAEHLKIVGGRTMLYSYQLWQETSQKDFFKQELVKQWKKENLDLCIGPTFICPAPRLKDIDWFLILGCYTTYYNLVDFPAGSVHVTTENEMDQERLNDYPAKDTMLKLVKETTTGAAGMPIGVQVIGLPFQDEAVLRGMKLIDELLKKQLAQS